MTGTGWRRVGLLVAAVGVLVAVGVGVGSASEADRVGARSSVAVSATGVIGSGLGGGFDTRVQRDVEVGQGRRTSHQNGVAGPASPGRSPKAVVAARAATLERAGHPERLGQILLRGPPGPSA